jgi:hypothetical protein
MVARVWLSTRGIVIREVFSHLWDYSGIAVYREKTKRNRTALNQSARTADVNLAAHILNKDPFRESPIRRIGSTHPVRFAFASQSKCL